ncbi:hypothetical protein CRG98_038591 [Punica granatum]|nr:hypothetical protein CRG98_038591 [Punica granatum]
MNLGELLMGDQMMNSPYRFRVNVNESIYLCTTHPLTKHDVDFLKKMTREMYQVNILLDTLPVRRYLNQHGMSFRWNRFPVGYYFSSIGEDSFFYSFSIGEGSYYIVNHLKFRVLIHKHEPFEKGQATAFEIVGFEVSPCSIKHDLKRVEKALVYSNDIGPITCPVGVELEKAQIIEEGQKVSFSYEVEFVKSDLRWSSWWDPYLKMEGSEVHSYSIINSAITVLFLMGVISRIFIRNMRERAGYQTVNSDKEAQPAKLSDEILTSKIGYSNSFNGPRLEKLLCVMVGSGIQIMGTAIITVTFAALGFISPASRGSLLVGIITFYLFLGILGGFVGVYLWKVIKGTSEGWKSISWSIASGFPGIVIAIHSVLNYVLWHQNSTGAIPLFVHLEIFSLWLGILVPLTLLGGYLGAQAEDLKCPNVVQWIPKKAGASTLLVWFLALGVGTLPFGTIFIELFYILSSLFLGRYYYSYGFLLMVLLLLIIICVLASMIVTYMSLRAEDSGWWWKAFWASGSVGAYVFLYCASYLIYDLQGLSGPESVVIYLGYSVILATLTILAGGSVGFLGSFYWVKVLSTSKEIISFSKTFNELIPRCIRSSAA